MNAMEIFRTGFAMGLGKRSNAKLNVESMYSRNKSFMNHAAELAKLQLNVLKAQENLDNLKEKVESETKELQELLEFLMPQNANEPEELWKERLGKNPHVGVAEKIQARFRASGKLKSLSMPQQDEVFNEIDTKLKAYNRINGYINGPAPEHIAIAENNLLQAKRVYEKYEKKELPDCHDPLTKEVFESILRLESLEEVEKNG